LQLQAIVDTSVDVSDAEDAVVVNERLAQIRKQLAEQRRTDAGR
jgi:hypothetical protein